METIFKIGDRVYDGIRKVWGTVTEIDENYLSTTYPIWVEFDNGYSETYTIDGERIVGQSRVLSFTEYDLVNGGFSQVRQLQEVKKDQLVYVKLQGNHEWEMRYFSHFDENGELWFFSNQKKSTEAESVTRAKAHEYLLENPLI